MLDKIKLALRISHNKLDDDIQHNITAALLDMQRVGIKVDDKPDDKPDDIICSACEMYIKWQYDYLGKGAQWERNYTQLRNALSQSSNYMDGDGNV